MDDVTSFSIDALLSRNKPKISVPNRKWLTGDITPPAGMSTPTFLTSVGKAHVDANLDVRQTDHAWKTLIPHVARGSLLSGSDLSLKEYRSKQGYISTTKQIQTTVEITDSCAESAANHETASTTTSGDDDISRSCTSSDDDDVDQPTNNAGVHLKQRYKPVSPSGNRSTKATQSLWMNEGFIASTSDFPEGQQEGRLPHFHSALFSMQAPYHASAPKRFISLQAVDAPYIYESDRYHGLPGSAFRTPLGQTADTVDARHLAQAAQLMIRSGAGLYLPRFGLLQDVNGMKV